MFTMNLELQHNCIKSWALGKRKAKLGAYAIKRAAAGVHLPDLWLFVTAKHLDIRVDYCLAQKVVPYPVRKNRGPSLPYPTRICAVMRFYEFRREYVHDIG